jgi:hypothetical protein
MKVTALIPDDLVKEVNGLAHGRSLTESLITALREWSSIQRLKSLSDQVRKTPLTFRKDFSAHKVRELNRRP